MKRLFPIVAMLIVISPASAADLTKAGVERGFAAIGLVPGMAPRRIDPLSPQEYRLISRSVSVHGGDIVVHLRVKPAN